MMYMYICLSCIYCKYPNSACTNCQNQEVPGLPTHVAPISGGPGDQIFSLTLKFNLNIPKLSFME